MVLGLSAAALCAAAAVPAFALGDAGARAVVSQSGEEEAESKVRLTVRGGRDARAGEGVRYRFSVRNTGRIALTTVRVSTRLPRSLKYLRGGTFRAATRTVVFSLGRLPPGLVRSRVMVARVADDFEDDSRIELRAKVSGRPATDSE